MLAEGDDNRLVFQRQHCGMASLGPVGTSATDDRFFHFATVFWLIP